MERDIEEESIGLLNQLEGVGQRWREKLRLLLWLWLESWRVKFIEVHNIGRVYLLERRMVVENGWFEARWAWRRKCSCLENPRDRGAWWAAVYGVTQSRTWLNDFPFTFRFHALEKEMATHSSVLAWRIPGTGEPGELPSMGSHRVGHDWGDSAAAAAPFKTNWIPIIHSTPFSAN